MECPIAMIDYESTQVAADWYEEYGQQEQADQIRYAMIHNHTLTLNVRMYRAKSRAVSISRTGVSEYRRLSTCKSTFNDTINSRSSSSSVSPGRLVSGCLANSYRVRLWSTSKSRSSE